jgi:hypothetical protein
MRHLPHNTHYAEKLGVIHGDCTEAGAAFALAAELKLMTSVGVEERLVFLLARSCDIGVYPVSSTIEFPVTRIAPTVWITVGAILGFKVLVH